MLKQDTFAGVLSVTGVNNVRLQINTPIAYFQALHKELNNHLKERGVKGTYTASIKVHPKDHRTFLSAEFRYGRRCLNFTNIAAMAHRTTKQDKTFCIKESTVTAIRYYRPAENARAWGTSHLKEWEKAGYKGHFTFVDTTSGPVLNGQFTHTKEDKKISVSSRFDKKQLVIKLIQIVTFIENIRENIKPEDWVRQTHHQLTDKEDKQKGGYTGFINTAVNSYDQLIIKGKYTKTVVLPNGSNSCEIIFYNSKAKPDSPKAERFDTENFRPTKKIGKSVISVRSIAQDDTYTPERRKGLTQHQEIQSEYHRYLKDMRLLDRVQLVQREIEYIKSQNRKQKVPKPVDKAKRWMQAVLKNEPVWLMAPNATMMIIYCKDQITLGTMTPHEANEFCKKNANKTK